MSYGFCLASEYDSAKLNIDMTLLCRRDMSSGMRFKFASGSSASRFKACSNSLMPRKPTIRMAENVLPSTSMLSFTNTGNPLSDIPSRTSSNSFPVNERTVCGLSARRTGTSRSAISAARLPPHRYSCLASRYGNWLSLYKRNPNRKPTR